MIYRVIILEAAENEMSEIAEYISDEFQSMQAAISLMREMRKQIRSLNTMPKRFPIVSDKKLANKGIRLLPVKNYIIFYVVNDQTKTVSIVSVMYNKRDWANLL